MKHYKGYGGGVDPLAALGALEIDEGGEDDEGEGGGAMESQGEGGDAGGKARCVTSGRWMNGLSTHDGSDRSPAAHRLGNARTHAYTPQRRRRY